MPSERRLHPASILFALLSQARALVLPALLLLFTSRAIDSWELLAPLFLIPAGLAALVRYLTFTYRYEPHELVIHSGLLTKNERHVPFARIQNLDAVENLLHRLLRVVEVRVHTGSGGEPEAVLKVLPRADFEEMRRRVVEGKAAAGQVIASAAEGGEVVPSAKAGPSGRTLLRLPPRELLLAGLISNRGGVVLAAAFGLLWEIGVFDRFTGGSVDELWGRGAMRELLRSLFGGSLHLSSLPAVAAAVALLLLAVRLLSMVWTLIRLHGFEVSRAGEDLRTEYGFFTRVAATIPRRRIQTLTIREGWLLRRIGRVSIKVETAGAEAGEEAATQREWLAPLLRRAELAGFLAEVLPGTELAAVSWQGVHPGAFRRELKRSLILAALATLPLLILGKLWGLALFAALAAWGSASARLTVRHLGWAVTEREVLFKSGWLVRQVTVARLSKVQAVAVGESPFDRRRGMARLAVDTAGAGDRSHRITIPYLARETADALARLLAGQAARTSFRW